MEYVISRETNLSRPTDEEISRAANSLLNHGGVNVPNGVIEVLICDHAVITDMNREFRHEDSTTDVLAFEMLEEDPESSLLIVGSIAVNSELAIEKAGEFSKSMNMDLTQTQICADAEVLLYILHGLLHFSGYDDEDPEDRKQMFEIAAEIICRLGYQVIPYDTNLEV